jgi:hypothetical protein
MKYRLLGCPWGDVKSAAQFQNFKSFWKTDSSVDQSDAHTCLMGENFSKWVDYDKAKGFYAFYLINKWHWYVYMWVCVFWKHNRRLDLTCHWHPQVKLIANKPTWVSFAHHWVWTQDLLWSKGKRHYFWVIPFPLA